MRLNSSQTRFFDLSINWLNLLQYTSIIFGRGRRSRGSSLRLSSGRPGFESRSVQENFYKQTKCQFLSSDLNSDYLDMPFGRGGPGTPGMPGSNSRTKRMRTSFKHHQLRTMKSYFAINHNPDAKDLKQLSQKTGLPKRVLQVRREATCCKQRIEKRPRPRQPFLFENVNFSMVRCSVHGFN